MRTPRLKTLSADCLRNRLPVNGGLEAAGIGRSKGGLTTKIHAAVDALGLPIRTIITPGQWGDSPQARGLIEGLTAAQHVIMDAAYVGSRAFRCGWQCIRGYNHPFRSHEFRRPLRE
ncbi:hypothetical protein E2K80_08830 [Rhodophyticola sp. CCM32]|nr:hypothetical protein E2K80_08830 [Rhodophyticola sp. CCM32]